MGSGSFDPAAYADFSRSTVGKSTDEVYSSRKLHKNLNPLGVNIRESRDSADSPAATPIIVALDVTGSMGIIADVVARKGLGTLFTSILDRKPVTNPHIMFMGVGDANCDQAPLQVSQFEADNRVVEQLTQLWIEHGGGNSFESYNLPWYFAAFHTEHDAIDKRGKRGYLFTVGDEEAPHDLTAAQIKHFIGDELVQKLSTRDTLELAQRKYNVFHVVIEEGNHFRGGRADKVRSSWNALLGQQVIYLADHTKLAETVVSAIEVAEGRDADHSAGAWGGDTARIVHAAVKDLPRGRDVPRLGGPL